MRSLTRTLAFFSKWMAEIARQPALMLSLVIGPFLVLLAFGEGVDVGGPRPKTLIVTPQTQSEIQPVPEELNGHIQVVGTTADLDYAREQLRKGKVDAVAVMPPDPGQTILSGQRIPLHILTNEIDPVSRSYARAYLADQVAELNQRTIAKAITDSQSSIVEARKSIAQARPFVDALGQSNVDLQQARDQLRQLQQLVGPITTAVDAADTAARGVPFVVPGIGRLSDQTGQLQGLVDRLGSDVQSLDRQLSQAEASGSALPSAADIDRIRQDLDGIDQNLQTVLSIPPDVLSAPFKLELENTAPDVPSFAAFYAPAVLVLLLQHLAITLGALSMARVRILGLMDMLRVAPVRPHEVVLGNYLSYGALCSVAGALLVTMSVFALSVPVFGPWTYLVLGLGLLITTSLGIGFVVAIFSSSEQQAAQVAMLILLASIFFSGFVFSLDRIAMPARVISYALPSTYAIRLVQDVMLRGVLRHPADLVVLGATTVALFAFTTFLFRREFRPA